MTPEEYERARRKLIRYGEHFDMSVNSRLPHPVVKTRAGKVAKRQPPYNERPKSYYQAQCSFRGLKTSGMKEELQQLLQHRDVSKDLIIERELDQLQSDKRIYENEQEVARCEQWWKDPTTAFEDKLQQRSQRALQEEVGKPDSFLLRSCRIYRGHRYDLSRAAATGEGKIQLEALEYVRSLTLSDSGLKLEGLFDCPYIAGPLRITGIKTAHGRGQKLSSAYEWSHLNQRAWDRACVTRWH
jgi:hypothetical protein